jgi:predicted  nucleic acid-binding Zn-ribbon protein
MIVKHRRGTTQEWHEVNLELIPEAGEFVIEECDNGTRRCKIGTGFTRFSELPYIDDHVRTELLAEITATREYLKNRINSVNEQFLEELDTIESELKTINTKCYELTSDYISRDANIVAILNKNISDVTALLKSEIADVAKSASAAQSETHERITSEVSQLQGQISDLNTAVNIEIANQISELDNQVNNTIVSEITRIEGELESNISALDTRITDHATEVANNISDVLNQTDTQITQLNDNIVDLKSTTNLEFIEVNNDISALDTAVQELISNTDNKFTEVENTVTENKAATETALETLTVQIDDTNTRIDDTNGEVLVQSKRIDSLIALPEGSTAADAELFDIRIGYNGIDHESAGCAVRAIGADLEALRNSLSQYIDTQAIDGLYYDYNGEVGLKQPYMLYLTANKEVLEDSGVQIIS